MITTNLLQELSDKGLLDKLFMGGVIGYKTYMMLPVRHKIDALMRQGKSHGEAVRMIAGDMRVHRSTIYRYL